MHVLKKLKKVVDKIRKKVLKYRPTAKNDLHRSWRNTKKEKCKKIQKKVLTPAERYDSISTLRVQQHRTQDAEP